MAFLSTNASRRTLLRMCGAVGIGLPVQAHSAFSFGANTRKNWWREEYRIVQTNLRAVDAAQDPAQIARDVREFGATTLLSNVGGIVAFYPTKLDLHYRNPYMKGDFTGRMIDAAHAAGLSMVGRFDLSKALKPVFAAHPDWFMRNRDRSVREYAGTYQACPSGGWAQDYAFRILEEALTRYPLDGIFFNMVGFTRTDYANVDHGICVCDNCRTRFKAMSGLDLPAIDDARDPNWDEYLQFQQKTLGDLARRTIALVRSTRPDAALMDFYAGDIARGEVQRRIDRPAPEWPYAMGEQVRWATGAAPNRPFSATSAAHIDYPWREATESAGNHLLRFAQALGTGGKLDLYLIGTLADQEDRKWLAPVSNLFKWHEANKAAYAGLRPAARVGLYSALTPFTGGEAKAPQPRRGAYKLLVDLRIPFTNIDAGRLASEGSSVLQDIDVIVMPDVRRISVAEARALDSFVEAGGLLIATGKTGGPGPAGAPRPAQFLRSSPVDAFLEEADAHGWSLGPREGPLPLADGRIAVDGIYFKIRTRASVRNLVRFAPDHPFGPPELAFPVAGAKARSEFGVALMPFGRGNSIHIPWQIDTLYYRHGLAAHRGLLGALISRYSPPPAVKLEGAGPVELTLQRQAETGALLAHVINYAGQRDTTYDAPPKLYGLRLGLRNSPATQARALRSGEALIGTRGADGYTWFDLPPVAEFEAIRIMPA